MTRSISVWRPMTGSSLPSSARVVRSVASWSTSGVLGSDLPPGLAVSGTAEGEELVLSCSTRRVWRRTWSGVTPSFLNTSMAAPSERDQPEQQVFGADVVVAHLAGLFDGVFEDELGIGGEFDLAAFVMPLAAHALDHLAHTIRFQAELAQNTPGHPAIFFQQAEQQVLRTDQSLVSALGFLVSQGKHTPCPLGKLFHASHKGLQIRQTGTRPALQSEANSICFDFYQIKGRGYV